MERVNIDIIRDRSSGGKSNEKRQGQGKNSYTGDYSISRRHDAMPFDRYRTNYISRKSYGVKPLCLT
jgi:hypothetical protein